MDKNQEIWRPGSFTKNFSWGPLKTGLKELHEVIRLGFDGKLQDVPRDEFRERVRSTGRPEYIPVNFFLFNKKVDGVGVICADELVFQALNWDHSPRFDKLALFSFILSYAGVWPGAKIGQRRPALWANAYILERVSARYNWDTLLINADDIEDFIEGDPRYHAQTTRKLSTNSNYLLHGGRINEFPSRHIERWWVDCLFLALDRIIEDRRLDGLATTPGQYKQLLEKNKFIELTGKRTFDKELALGHLVSLYAACDGLRRFSEDAVKERTELLIPDVKSFLANDPRPRGAVHATNPRILKSLPSACAMLAKYAGFQDLSPDELENFNIEEFIRKHTQEALRRLKAEQISPNMSAEELLKLTRGE